MENIFEKASRQKLRFNINGSVSTEMLWDADLNQLMDYEVELKKATKDEEPRRRGAGVNVKAEANKLRLEIVSYILDTRIEAQKAAHDRLTRDKEIQEILGILKDKEREELLTLDKGTLEARLKELTEAK